jgi:hypothetical protein
LLYRLLIGDTKMSPEKQSGGGEKSGGGKGSGREGDKRRYFRSRKRGRKATAESSAESSGSSQPNSKGEGKGKSAPPVSTDEAKARRERRRRRRMKSKRKSMPDMVAPMPVVDDEVYPEPKKVLVYTHVLRPSLRDSYEFRADTFGKVTRQLEDFNINIASLFAPLAADGTLPIIPPLVDPNQTEQEARDAEAASAALRARRMALLIRNDDEDEAEWNSQEGPDDSSAGGGAEDDSTLANA